MSNFNTISHLIQFILAEAARDDDWNARELGPIHIIKFLYLSDLYEAEAGRPLLTGLPWRFQSFGPYASRVENVIDRVTVNTAMNRRDVEGRYGDFVRWRYPVDGTPYEEVRAKVSASVRVRLSLDIRRYGNRTPELLHRVYATQPMLNAAPGDILNFDNLHRPTLGLREDPQVSLFKRSKKRRSKLIRTFAAEMRNRRAVRAEGVASMFVEPRVDYDEVYFRGLNELEPIEVSVLTELAPVIEIDDSVWSSEMRRDSDG